MSWVNCPKCWGNEFDFDCYIDEVFLAKAVQIGPLPAKVATIEEMDNFQWAQLKCTGCGEEIWVEATATIEIRVTGFPE